jgi:hypothetical protein|tara:strand:- start:371 stop:739 length:369 start_codon:yes stop_codon:yes gene_type:complete
LQHPILFKLSVGKLAAVIAFPLLIVTSCSTTQMQDKLISKSNPSLCYSMIYQKDSLSDDYFSLMLKEALKRDLNCKDIAQEILDFRKKLTGDTRGGGPDSSGDPSSNNYSNEGINWVTGQST